MPSDVWPKKKTTKKSHVHDSLQVMGSTPGYLLKSSLLYTGYPIITGFEESTKGSLKDNFLCLDFCCPNLKKEEAISSCFENTKNQNKES